MEIPIDDLKKECQYCYREIDNSGLEGFRCTNRTAIKARGSSWCYPKNANEPCSICEYCEPIQTTTFKDLYGIALSKLGLLPDAIDDYRPVCEIYVEQLKEPIPNAIMLWLKTGEQIIFINKPEQEEE